MTTTTPSIFSVTQWIAWLGATLVACVTLTSFAYTNFETKDHAVENKGDLVQRLDRMENKLDLIVRRGE